jgi:hypothetical protein
MSEAFFNRKFKLGTFHMPDYDFHTLSSFDFELLVRDLLQAETGVRYESFKQGKDQGIDLRYSSGPGNVEIVQAKHYGVSGFKPLLRHLKVSEAAKVQKLSPRRYLIATSVPLSELQKDEIASVFRPYVSEKVSVMGKEDLNNLLGLHPNIEQQHFKLWLESRAILSSVLHAGTINATRYEVENIKRRVRLYVQGDSFNAAQTLLEKQRVCIISGVPGVGKTTLAEMLLLYYLSNGYTPYQITTHIREAFEVDDPDPEARIVYYYDDFLGQTNLMERFGKNEDASLLKFIEHVHHSPNRRFILTTREYLLRKATLAYEKMRTAELKVYKFVLDIGKYTRTDRARILYNHLYFSTLPASLVDELVASQAYLNIIDHPNFNPRLIGWMTRKGVESEVGKRKYSTEFCRAIANPTTVWESAYESHIGEMSRNVLLVLLSMGGLASLSDLEAGMIPYLLAKHESTTIPSDSMRTTIISCLKELDGTFTSSWQVTYGENKSPVIGFHNPSIKDFISLRLSIDLGEAITLLRAAHFVEQCIHILNIFGQSQNGVGASEEFMDTWLHSTRRTLRNSQTQYAVTAFSGPSAGVTQQGNSFERLCLRIMAATKGVKRSTKWSLLCDCQLYFIERLESRHVDITEACNVLEEFRRQMMSPFIQSVADVICDADEINEFEFAIGFMDEYRDFISDSSNELLRERFESWCEDAMDYLDGEPSDGYREAANKIERLAGHFRINVDAKLSKIRETADEEEQKEQSYNSSGSRAVSVGANDKSLSSNLSDLELRDMFSGLLNSQRLTVSGGSAPCED